MTNVGAIVARLAAELLPGWAVTWEWCQSADIGGALAMVFPTPARSMAHIKIAPHPPTEKIEESIAHEITHAVISPLVALVEATPAAAMIEEPIVERIGKFIAKHAGLARVVSRALQNPRTNSPAVRARISALASRRRLGGRYRMDPKAIAELAMEAGTLAAMEGLDPKVGEFLKKVVAAMSGGSTETVGDGEARDDGQDGEQDMSYRNDEQTDQQSGQMRGQRGRQGKQESLAEARMRTAALSATKSAIRMRIHEARTVDGFQIPAELEKKILAAKSIEDADTLLDVARLARAEGGGGKPRGSSGAEQGAGGDGGLSEAELIKEGIRKQLAASIVAESKNNPESAKRMLTAARQRLARESAKNGDK